MKKLIVLNFIIICFFELLNAKPYIYPHLPGSDEWEKQNSYVDLIKLCEIPSIYLDSMSTVDLLESFFNFPLSQNLILYDNYLEGYNSMKAEFNGLSAFIDRSDAPEILLKSYVDENNDLNITHDIIIEGFLSVDAILKNIDFSQKEIVLEYCLAKLFSRLEKKSFLTQRSLFSATYLLINLLSSLDQEIYYDSINGNDDVKNFHETSYHPSNLTMIKVLDAALKYKNRKDR